MSEKPYLAPTDAGAAMILRPIDNGGWVVSGGNPSQMLQPKDLGAFSNSNDMLEALVAGLAPGASIEFELDPPLDPVSVATVGIDPAEAGGDFSPHLLDVHVSTALDRLRPATGGQVDWGNIPLASLPFSVRVQEALEQKSFESFAQLAVNQHALRRDMDLPLEEIERACEIIQIVKGAAK